VTEVERGVLLTLDEIDSVLLYAFVLFSSYRGAANEKPGMNTPFALFNEMTAAGMWAPTCKKNLNDKMDYYFQDFGIMPLMVQVSDV